MCQPEPSRDLLPRDHHGILPQAVESDEPVTCVAFTEDSSRTTDTHLSTRSSGCFVLKNRAHRSCPSGSLFLCDSALPRYSLLLSFPHPPMRKDNSRGLQADQPAQVR